MPEYESGHDYDQVKAARPDGPILDRLARIEKELAALLDATNGLESVLRPALTQEERPSPHLRDDVPAQLAPRVGSSRVFIALSEIEDRVRGIAGRLREMAQGVEL